MEVLATKILRALTSLVPVASCPVVLAAMAQ
jgi:hypothetical protein